MRDLALELRSRQPDWVFKKVDSVLRGNVLAEISSIGRALKLPRTLLVPANPNVGRTIRDGIYYVGGTPIHRTDFRHDPRHPRRSPRVLELLGKPGSNGVSLQAVGAQELSPGINVGEVSTFADVQQWAALADEMTLVAGGADFFRALLERRAGMKSEVRSPKSEGRLKSENRKQPRGGSSELRRLNFPAPALFVCGSLAESSLQFIAARRKEGWPVLLIPKTLLGTGRTSPACLARWAADTAQALARHPRVIIGIGQARLPGARTPERLGRLLTRAVEAVLARSQPAAICSEGGATTAQLLTRLGWQRLSVAGEFATGVVGLRPSQRPDLLLICKPGSYRWPEAFAASDFSRPQTSVS